VARTSLKSSFRRHTGNNFEKRDLDRVCDQKLKNWVIDLFIGLQSAKFSGKLIGGARKS